MDNPFLNDFPDVFDPFLFCFNTGRLKFHKRKTDTLSHSQRITFYVEESWLADKNA